LAEREKEKKDHGESKKLLTGISLLMEGVDQSISIVGFPVAA
jgi:hypothetical protein